MAKTAKIELDLSPLVSEPRFQSRVSQHEANGMIVTTFIPIPHDLGLELSNRGIKRLLVEIDHIPIKRALFSDGQGGFYILVGKNTLRDLKLGIGATVNIHIAIDPDPDAVDLPEELEEYLLQDEEFASQFNALTPGMRRSLAYYVTTAKKVDTRINRCLELAHKMKHNQLYIQRNKKS